MNAVRPQVFCPGCGWRGRRLAAGGPCAQCQGRVKLVRIDPARGNRVRWTLFVKPETWERLTARQGATILDRAAKRKTEET